MALAPVPLARRRALTTPNTPASRGGWPCCTLPAATAAASESSNTCRGGCSSGGTLPPPTRVSGTPTPPHARVPACAAAGPRSSLSPLSQRSTRALSRVSAVHDVGPGALATPPPADPCCAHASSHARPCGRRRRPRQQHPRQQPVPLVVHVRARAARHQQQLALRDAGNVRCTGKEAGGVS